MWGPLTPLGASLFPFSPPPFLFSLLLATSAMAVRRYPSLCQDGRAILARTEEVWFRRCLHHGLVEPLVRPWLLRFPADFCAASEGGPCSPVMCPPATCQGTVGVGRWRKWLDGYGKYEGGMVSVSGLAACHYRAVVTVKARLFWPIN
ncbi:uncharacterized protein LOC109707468 isoform X2 [Ananas comosus]|uniref:Uncharacterized protein LOC109707468 isoform X2 n=1 Tax=Ananas comosus TaxID=4615 RepID=A0A6P5ELJ2_ANACO|nr:uncharacterized protein LOC109707468 isoform X2 [Ananas comosus]